MTPPTIVITLGFNPVEMMRASFKRLDETIGLTEKEYMHVIVDQHYPRGREQILGFFEERKKKSNTIILDPGSNFGIARGVNFALSFTGIQPDDNFIFYDPDTFPVESGWGIAMEDVLEDKKVGWVSLFNRVTERETVERGYHNRVTNGRRVRQTKAAVVNSVCAMPGRFLIASHGVHEPNPYYGGFEISMWEKLQEQRLEWVFLRDFTEGHRPNDLIDQDYIEYKWFFCHGEGRKQLQTDFKDWLKERGR